MKRDIMYLYIAILKFGFSVVNVDHYSKGYYAVILSDPKSSHQPIALLTPSKQ